MKLTIVTAIYNRIDGLNKVFECLDNQTYKNFSHILVDDCSTEIDYNGLQVICQERLNTSFVRLGFRSHYYGCFARNIGTQLAFSQVHHSQRDIDNEWVAYLDTDNLWLPNHLESLIDVAEKNNASMVGADMIMFGANDNSWRQLRRLQIKQGYCDIGSFIYKTRLFRDYGYWFAHPHRKQKWDYELINTFSTFEEIYYTHQPTFLMSYRKK